MRCWGYLRESPALYVEKPRVERKEMDFLVPEEIRSLLEQVRPQFHALFLSAVLTGMRRGELLGLQWGDIDWNGDQIPIRRSLYFEAPRKGKERRWRFITPKSKNSVRAINMSPTLAPSNCSPNLPAWPSAWFRRWPNRHKWIVF